MLGAIDSVFQSTIIASNTAGQGCTQKCADRRRPIDLASGGSTITITGANNLIVSSASTITLPNDTLASDPQFAPFLESNGGPTQTLALNGVSPAIDHGNNALDLASDQRGAPFCRKVGSKTDIVAFKTQTAGTGCGLIFANGFQPLP